MNARPSWLQQHTHGFRATADWQACVMARPWLPAIDCANRIIRVVRERSASKATATKRCTELNAQLAADLREVARVLNETADEIERPRIFQ